MPPSSPEPRELIARIVAAARRHFMRHGFRGVTMAELAAEMGMSKKTLYVHFSSKHELLSAVVDDKLGSFERDMDALGTRSQTFARTLAGLLACVREHTEELGPLFVRDMARDAPELVDQVKARRAQVIARTFGRVLKEGQRAGAVRRDVRVEFLVELLLCVVGGLVTPDKLAEYDCTPPQLIRSVLSIFLEGALTAEGRRSL